MVNLTRQERRGAIKKALFGGCRQAKGPESSGPDIAVLWC